MGLITPSPELAALLARCHANQAPLSAWERRFLDKMAWRRTMSVDQRAVLARIADRVDPKAVSAALAGRMADLATLLVGAEGVREGDDLRFRSRGSLSVMLAGPERGRFFDHEAGEGGDGIRLIQHLRRCRFGEAVEWAKDWLGMSGTAASGLPGEAAAAATARAIKEAERDAKAATYLRAAQNTWCGSSEPAGTLVETYLQSRGLALPHDAPIRFHGRCPRGKGAAREYLPAMVALMTDPVTGEPVGIHRTYLRPDGAGKANGKNKMMLGVRGVVRLAAEPGPDGLGICEGIETGLAIRQIAGWPSVWAATCAGAIGCFPILPEAKRLTVFPDMDDDGASRAATDKAIRRWCDAGREVVVWSPPDGTDWCAALTKGAA